MAGRLAGKKALVTGAAQGLGEAIARAMAAEGAQVALADINLDGAMSVADSINNEHAPNTAHAFALDVTNEEQWVIALGSAARAMNGLSVLVNNAGIFVQADIEELEFSAWKRAMSVNADSVFLGTKYALPHLRQSQPAAIVNISSIAAMIAGHNIPAYNASKAAVWMLTKSVALHCAKQGLDIRCNSIHPTFIGTPLLDSMKGRFTRSELEAKLARQVPAGRIGSPSDVANAVLYLASDESRLVTGAELKVDGGISAQ
ncbi:MAG: SDR family oxidoreductase [Caulobacterales bacterium]